MPTVASPPSARTTPRRKPPRGHKGTPTAHSQKQGAPSRKPPRGHKSAAAGEAERRDTVADLQKQVAQLAFEFSKLRTVAVDVIERVDGVTGVSGVDAATKSKAKGKTRRRKTRATSLPSKKTAAALERGWSRDFVDLDCAAASPPRTVRAKASPRKARATTGRVSRVARQHAAPRRGRQQQHSRLRATAPKAPVALSSYNEVPNWLRSRKEAALTQRALRSPPAQPQSLSALDRTLVRGTSAEGARAQALAASIEQVIEQAVSQRLAADRAMNEFEAVEAFARSEEPLNSRRTAAVRRAIVEREEIVAARLRSLRRNEAESAAVEVEMTKRTAELGLDGAAGADEDWVLLRVNHSWTGALEGGGGGGSMAGSAATSNEGSASRLLPLKRGQHLLALRNRRRGEWWWGKCIGVSTTTTTTTTAPTDGWFPASFVSEQKRGAANAGSKTAVTSRSAVSKKSAAATEDASANPAATKPTRWIRLRCLYDWDGGSKRSALQLTAGKIIFGLRSCCGAPPSNAEEGWWWWGGETRELTEGGWFPARYIVELSSSDDDDASIPPSRKTEQALELAQSALEEERASRLTAETRLRGVQTALQVATGRSSQLFEEVWKLQGRTPEPQTVKQQALAATTQQATQSRSRADLALYLQANAITKAEYSEQLATLR